MEELNFTISRESKQTPIEELSTILKEDKYIGYNEYKDLCEKNNLTVNEELLNTRNKEFIDRKLIEYKEYFDHMFTDVGENINLDEEQRKIVLRNDDYCLINAGAGSGKSTTMAAKVKYLVDKLNVNPQEIIMLTFTKKSSEELDEKVNDLLDLGIPVSTFHSLGMKFIKKCNPNPVQVVGEDEQKEIICSYIKELFKDKEKLKELIFLYKQYENRNYIAKGFIENFEKFDNFEEYFEDYKKRKYTIEEAEERRNTPIYIKQTKFRKHSLYNKRRKGEIIR